MKRGAWLHGRMIRTYEPPRGGDCGTFMEGEILPDGTLLVRRCLQVYEGRKPGVNAQSGV